MDKRKLALYALLAVLSAGMVYGGIATWDQWSGFISMMLQAR
ncbi:MAG TPA: hypothetical protein VIT62_08930 [Lysobacter sp.]